MSEAKILKFDLRRTPSGGGGGDDDAFVTVSVLRDVIDHFQQITEVQNAMIKSLVARADAPLASIIAIGELTTRLGKMTVSLNERLERIERLLVEREPGPTGP